MSAVTHQSVTGDEEGMRLDRWFHAHFPHLTHGRLQKLLRTGQVRVDGARAKANFRLEPGQEVRIPPLPEAGAKRPRRVREIDDDEAEFVRGLVIFKDNDLIAINKPSGLAVQGGSKTERHLDGLLDALKFDADDRPRLVHRLDRDTSGVMVLARNRRAANALTAAFRARTIAKTYWALVAGVPGIAAGTINLAVFKAGRAGDQKMRVAEPGQKGAQNARTNYEVIERAGNKVSWLSLEPETGRTHQLRVHLAAIGHPILGDAKYGDNSDDPMMEIATRPHLHARSLQLPRNLSKGLEIEAPLAADLARSWRHFGFNLPRGG